MLLCATLCNNFAIGLYAGNIRAQFRNKYSLHGSIDIDTFLHCMFSNFAVCQEAQEIRDQIKMSQKNIQLFLNR